MDFETFINEFGIVPILMLIGFSLCTIGPTYCAYGVKKGYYSTLQAVVYAISAFAFGIALMMTGLV